MTEGGNLDGLSSAAIWYGELTFCARQNHVFWVRSNCEIVLTDYLRAVAGSTYGKEYFLSIAWRTTGIASINKDQLGKFPVPIPPTDLQSHHAKLASHMHCMAYNAGTATARTAVLNVSLMSRLLGAGA